LTLSPLSKEMQEPVLKVLSVDRYLNQGWEDGNNIVLHFTSKNFHALDYLAVSQWERAFYPFAVREEIKCNSVGTTT